MRWLSLLLFVVVMSPSAGGMIARAFFLLPLVGLGYSPADIGTMAAALHW
jgi:hypothetical protein